MIKSKLPVVLICLFAFSTLKAQDKVTLQQAIDLGLKNNPNLKVSSAKIRVAESRLTQAEEQRLPHADASLAYSHYQILTPFALSLGGPKPLFELQPQGFDATIGSASVSENIFSGFRVKSNIKAAGYLVEASRLDAEKDKSDLSYTIASAYFNIYKIIKSGEVIDENMKALDEKIRELQSLERNGVALHNDVLKVELQKTNLQISKMEVESAKTSAYYSLAIMTGLPENTAYTIDTMSLFTPAPSMGIADLQNQAFSERKELKTNALKIKAENENINALKSYYYPSLGASVSYYYINPSKDIIPDKDAFINAGGVGISLSYNISALWETGKLDESRANVAQLNDVTEAQTNQIKSEVFTNYTNWQLNNEKIKLSQAAIDQAAENYATMNSRYKNNISTMTELMDANTMLLQAQLTKVNTMTDAKLAYIKLMYSTGK